MILTINANTEYGRKAIRKKAHKEINEFINSQVANIFLLNTACGTGKTALAVKLFKDSKYKDTAIFYLAPNHYHCENEVVSKVNQNVLYLKGIKQECENPDYQTIRQRGFKLNIQRVLCSHCPTNIKNNCHYYSNIEKVKHDEDVDKVVTVQHYINTAIIEEFFNKFDDSKEKILIIDEDFFDALTNPTRITPSSLKQMAKNLEHMTLMDVPKQRVAFINSIWSLIQTFESNGRIIEQKEFTDRFFERIQSLDRVKKMPISIKELRHLFLHDWSRFYENYTEALYNHMINHGFENDYTDQIHHIVTNCLEYKDKDVLLPFYTFEKSRYINGKRHREKKLVDLNNTTNLPNVPILVMDATVQAEIIQDVFNRDVYLSELPGDIEIKRNVIQFMQGNYTKESLKNITTLRNVLNNIKDLIKFERNRITQPKIGIISYKLFLPQIKHILREYGLVVDQITFDWFGHLRGSNKFNGCTTLFVLGTYIPNIQTFPRDLGGWYVGETPLEKIINPHGREEYTDKRYKQHLHRIRDAEMIQAIDRIRFLFDRNKIVYLFSKIELPIETKQYPTVDNFIFRDIGKYNTEYVYLKNLVEQGSKQRYIFHNRLNRRVPFRNETSSSIAVTRTYENLLEKEYIKNERGKISVTPKGKKLFEKLKNRNS